MPRICQGIPTVATAAIVLPLLALTLRAQTAAAPDAIGQLQSIAEKYDIEIEAADPHFPVTTRHGKITGRKADTAALDRYLPLFTAEWTLYPPTLVKRSHLKRIVLCENLSFAGQRRGAVPDYEHDVLYLDISRGAHSEPYLRKVIHHEFFHILDYQDDGVVYRDDRWARLNPKSFKYGTGGQHAQKLSQTSVLTDESPGFLNHYSTTGVEEDKAEVFANLMVDPTYVDKRASKDAVLQAKVQQMKDLLASFCADVNADFWDKVKELR